MAKKLKTFIVVIIVGIFLFSVYLGVKSMWQHKALTDSKSARKAEEPLPVKTVDVKYGNIDEQIGAECVTKESTSIEVNTSIAGKIVQIHADIGDTVTSGQTLIEYDSADFLSLLSASYEMLASAKQQLQEIDPYTSSFRSELKKTNSAISYIEFLRIIKEKREVKFLLAKARIDIVNGKKNLSSTKIMAPFDGIVIESFVEKGIFKPPYEKLMKIVSIDPLFMECEISEDKLQSITVKQLAEVSFSAYPGRTFKGEVFLINPVIDKVERTAEILIKINGDTSNLMLGAHGIVRLINNKNSLRIPSTALLNVNGNSATVFIVDQDNVTHLKNISIGAYAEGYTEVVSGLSENDEVVIVGQIALKDNDKVIKHN